MAIAYSGNTITRAFIRTDSSAHFLADIDALLLGCNWSVAHTVTNGKVYECTAPISVLKARLLVQWDGSIHVIFQMMSDDETVTGIPHTIRILNGVVPIYQAICGQCQLFLSVPGRVGAGYGDDQSSSFAGGIPCLPPNTPAGTCNNLVGNYPTVTDCWWSCGPGNNPFTYQPDFRSSPTCYNGYCFSLNKVVVIVADGYAGQPAAGFGFDPSQGELALAALTPTYNTDNPVNPYAPVVTYSFHQALRIDALLLFHWIIRGQLWDAFLMTAPQVLDAPMSFTDTALDGSSFQVNVQVWSSANYASLMLLTESPFGLGRFGYIY